MECTDCGTEFEERKETREMKAELSNPGVVFFQSKGYECPNCKQHFTEEADIEDAMDSFDREHSKKSA